MLLFSFYCRLYGAISSPCALTILFTARYKELLAVLAVSQYKFAVFCVFCRRFGRSVIGSKITNSVCSHSSPFITRGPVIIH